MQIRFDHQDVTDAVHVHVAMQHNRGRAQGSRPHDVQVELQFAEAYGIGATGVIDGAAYRLDEQGVQDAVAVYLAEYYSFVPDRLLINLSCHGPANTFGADIIVSR